MDTVFLRTAEATVVDLFSKVLTGAETVEAISSMTIGKKPFL